MTDALRGKLSPPTAPQDQPADAQQDGTAASGYVTPDLGPFECGNCTKFQAPNHCGDPRVQQDPEVQGQVEPEGCCNFFQSAQRERPDNDEGYEMGDEELGDHGYGT